MRSVEKCPSDKKTKSNWHIIAVSTSQNCHTMKSMKGEGVSIALR